MSQFPDSLVLPFRPFYLWLCLYLAVAQVLVHVAERAGQPFSAEHETHKDFQLLSFSFVSRDHHAVYLPLEDSFTAAVTAMRNGQCLWRREPGKTHCYYRTTWCVLSVFSRGRRW